MATTTRTAKPGYRCTECGWTAAKWVGQCGECQAWGTVVEAGAAPSGPATKATVATSAARPIGDVDATASERRATGVDEFDRVLGGGLVPGAVVLLAGEPGVGKSTLLLDVAARAARAQRTVLYVTGEESAGQVRLRAERIGALDSGMLLAAETDLGAVLAHIEQVGPDLLMVDSIQTIASAAIDGTAGGVSQVREVASALIQAAKTRGFPMVLVGHVTREGTVAGPRIVEHLVDVVCQFEGEQHSQLRLLRSIKNRFGSVDEVGCFQLLDTGIEGVADPSGLFLSREGAHVAGTCATITIDGKRPLPAEIQALVAPSALSNPRRATSGIDSSRVAMILAVLQRRVGVAVAADDVYVSTIGGARVTEPAADVALALALASARIDAPVRPGLAAIGEVALSGAVRPVTGVGQRVAEAARLGFTEVLVPASGTPVDAPRGVQVHTVASLREAVELAVPRP
ncbi:DNA repair protein RadA [Demequina activiva]|uniref:DNA repair protein RadA n=1 Tax=Demequina activiva TaxID=1582364 RepID=A0A919Q5Q5_9MICO|nr:DNA repair protein RadA [Demequina activiva]GIG55013.1 DNA repair protein RadA [Demequina activiva]